MEERDERHERLETVTAFTECGKVGLAAFNDRDLNFEQMVLRLEVDAQVRLSPRLAEKLVEGLIAVAKVSVSLAFV